MQKRESIRENWGAIFRKEPILMLRFLRYGVELGEALDGDIKDAILTNSVRLIKADKKEIESEFRKILVSRHPDMLRQAYELGLTATFLPEFDKMMETEQNNPHHLYSVGEHTLHALLQIPPDPLLRYAILLHDVGKPATKTTDERGIDHFYEHYSVGRDIADAIMKRMGLNETEIKIIGELIEWHDYRWESPGKVTKNNIRKMIGIIGRELILPLLRVQRADVLAQSNFKQENKLAVLSEVEKIYYEVIETDGCMDMRNLNINGNQLMQLGIRDIREISNILQILFWMVINEPKLNEYPYLAELAMRMKEEEMS
ncbi:MAG: HD domain-containing protein [Lachnospiraceae bacterium]